MPNVPQISLEAKHGEQVFTVEAVMLLMAAKDDRAWLVPASFKTGAFRSDDDLVLRYVAKAPAQNFETAESSIIRAYDRLRTNETDQLDRGESFKPPELATAADRSGCRGASASRQPPREVSLPSLTSLRA